jgi:hypothetical protein
MEISLLLSACILVALSVVTAGRFRFIPVREGNSLDRLFIKLQLGLNIVSIPLAALLPIVTKFEGQPWLAFVAVALVTASLVVYSVQLPPLLELAPSTRGKRSIAAADLRRTRWPYQTLFALGYLALVVYAFPLASSYQR